MTHLLLFKSPHTPQGCSRVSPIYLKDLSCVRSVILFAAPCNIAVNIQWQLSRTDNDEVLEDYMEEVRKEKIMNGEISLLGVMQVKS